MANKCGAPLRLPIPKTDPAMSEISAIVDVLCSRRDAPAALATLVAVEGSSYRRPGARLLVFADGTHLGSISGGCLEEDLKIRAHQVIERNRAEVVTYDTTAENDLVWGVGLGCQGVVRILIEPIPATAPVWAGKVRSNLTARRPTELVIVHGGSAALGTSLDPTGAQAASADVFCQEISAPPALVIFGAGDDARPLVQFATTLGWQVTVADARATYATAERFPQATLIHVAPAVEQPALVALDAASNAVVMTHRYRDDLALLRRLLPTPVGYLGLLGPRKRTNRLLDELARDGFTPTPAMLEKLHAPVGLDLGGDGPEAVALAIVAEIQMRISGRGAGHLKERPGSIHG